MLLKDYLQDGAKYQARAVLCALQGMGDIEQSWNDEYKIYEAEINIGRWENCREQGYVVSMRLPKGEPIHICWFEHRNSDNICALKWRQYSDNTPTIDTIPEKVFPDKWHNDFSVSYGEYQKMADWIFEELINAWITASNI